MQQQVKKDNLDINPLNELTTLLHNDMEEVNKHIIKNMQSDIPLIPKLAGYLINSGGKRIRPLLTLATTKLYGYEGSRAYGLSAAVEFIHTATLLHDDVVDESEKRRGKKAANLVFGNKASVLVGDFLFSKSFQLMTKDGSIEILDILSNASAVIAQGEVLQLSATNNIDITLEQYYEIISSKTAALFAAATQIGPVIAGADKQAVKAMYDYGHYLGMAFQMADDILDYNSSKEAMGKNIGDDFREGKLTAPVIIALSKANEEEKKFWKRTLQNLNQKDEDLETAIKLINKHNALQETIKLAKNFADKAMKAIEKAPNHKLKSLLKDIINYTIERNS